MIAHHQCELGHLYDKFDEMKSKYSNARVLWMGDLNRSLHDQIVKDTFTGNIGGKSRFQVEDLAKSKSRTYYTGGIIDWILGEKGQFEYIEGGSTGAGTPGQKIGLADHFPIFTKVEMK